MNNIKTFRELLDIADPLHEQIPLYYIKGLINVDAFRKSKHDYQYISKKFIKYDQIEDILKKVKPLGTLKDIQEQYIQAFRSYILQDDVLSDSKHDSSDVIFEQGSDNLTLNATHEGLIVYLRSQKKYDLLESDQEVYSRVLTMFEKHYEKHFDWLNKYNNLQTSIKTLPEHTRKEITDLFLKSIDNIDIRNFVHQANG